MPYKPGGGYLPQPYDPNNGQYTDKEIISLNENDILALKELQSTNTITIGREPHFPTYGIHNEEHNKLFVEIYRRKFTNPNITEDKAVYLMTFNKYHDKSKFLYTIGYSKYDLYGLKKDIIKKTDYKNMKYSKIKQGGYLIAKALTSLNGYLVTTI